MWSRSCVIGLQPSMSPQQRIIKRGFDLLAAGFGLLVLSPLLALIAAAIRMDSRGPILFRQQRMGLNMRPFYILKFRTMVINAANLGPAITADRDPRITRVGQCLRATKLDELPQLWNIIRGEMSLVGPRPEVAKYVEMFPEDYQQILSVRPGLTDLASLKYRDESRTLALAADPEQHYTEQVLPDKIELAKQYIAHSSLRLDLVLILKTIQRLFR